LDLDRRPELDVAGSRLPWASIVIIGVAGALVALAAVGFNLALTGKHAVDLLDAGGLGPAAHAIAVDFPHAHLPSDQVGGDGQQYYAIARTLPHLAAAAPELDRPQYRLQRIGFPALGWLLHPSGGGPGLVIALLFVNALGVALLCGGAAALLALDKTPPAWALTALIAPGLFLSLRSTAADALALGLAVAAVVAARRRHFVLAALLAAGAALTREPIIVALLGLALPFCTRSWRHNARLLGALVAAPALAVAGWFLAVHATVAQAHHLQVREFAPPFFGAVDAVRYWRQVGNFGPAVIIGITVGMVLVALIRREIRCGPYGVAIVLQVALLAVLAAGSFRYVDVTARIELPVMVFALLGFGVAEHAGGVT
jgi:hypothetical protein